MNRLIRIIIINISCLVFAHQAYAGIFDAPLQTVKDIGAQVVTISQKIAGYAVATVKSERAHAIASIVTGGLLILLIISSSKKAHEFFQIAKTLESYGQFEVGDSMRDLGKYATLASVLSVPYACICFKSAYHYYFGNADSH